VVVEIHVFFNSALAGGGQLQAPTTIPPGKKPLVPSRWMDGPQNWSRRHGDKNLAPTGTRIPNQSAVQPVAIPTVLFPDNIFWVQGQFHPLARVGGLAAVTVPFWDKAPLVRSKPADVS
jgi:hypothetical protein